MALIKWTPFYEPAFDIERAFNELGGSMNFNPAIDMYEKEDALHVDVALAGIDPKNMKIDIENNVLNIEGSMEKKSEVDENNYYRKEVRAGSFHRMISLPFPVNGQDATAAYEKGMLKITLPKKEEAKPKPISIEVKNK